MKCVYVEKVINLISYEHSLIRPLLNLLVNIRFWLLGAVLEIRVIFTKVGTIERS